MVIGSWRLVRVIAGSFTVMTMVVRFHRILQVQISVIQVMRLPITVTSGLQPELMCRVERRIHSRSCGVLTV